MSKHYHISRKRTSYKIDFTTTEYLDTGSTNPTITSTTLVDVPGISTTYENKRAFPVKICVTLDFMALGNGLAGFFFAVNVGGTDSVKRFTSLPNALWTSLNKDFFFTVPANTTVTIKPRAQVGASQSMQWARDASDPGYRTRIIVREMA